MTGTELARLNWAIADVVPLTMTAFPSRYAEEELREAESGRQLTCR